MTIPLEQASLMFSPHTSAQQFQLWVSQPALNVKGFGAKGDGVTDDTAAIQACFTAAFTAAGNGLNSQLNYPVFFPPGKYIVSSPTTTTVTGSASGTGGAVKLTVNSTTGFTTGDRVQVAGVLGTTEANGAWYITVDDGTHMTLGGSAWVHAWSAGGTQTVKAPCLKIKNTWGARIYGSGRGTTQITANASACAVLCLDGFGYSSVEHIEFDASTDGMACDYSWNNVGVSSQSVRFINCNFYNGAYGLAIGMGGAMSSETSIHDCSFGPQTIAGLTIGNQNALATKVFGGNFASCAIAINGVGAPCEIVHGVSFQGNTSYDIYGGTSNPDNFSVHGCRTESPDNSSFLFIHAGASGHVAGCTQIKSQTGAGLVFAFIEGGTLPQGNGSLTVDSCTSADGIFTGNGLLYIRGNPAGNKCFGNANYLTSFTGTVVQNI